MNKTNGVRDTASVSTSLYLKEHNCGQRSSSTAFPTFLKWFKKNEKRQKAINGLVSSNSSKLTDSPEALSPPSSPFPDNISPSSSCDSVLSTSTTGFAFIKPQYYRPYNYAEEPKLLFTDNLQTETHRRRENKYNCYNIENRQLSLREKYFLYDTDTITSNEIESGYDNIRYLDRSLPNAKKKSLKNNNQSIRNRRPHRRTVSDCSKDKRSGAYVHVKGKRKAPPPPQLVLHRSQARHEYFYEDVKTERVSSPSEIYSSGSTLGRKKRKAPPPPAQSPTSLLDEAPKSILSEGLLDDKEIQAIIEGASTGYNIVNSTEKNCKMFSKRTPMKSSGKQDHPMDKSKGVSNENLSSTSNHEETESPNRSPISAISPRPWYKRPISTNRESSIPFKREIVLKTMEKRKNKLKEKEAVSTSLPEVGYSRSSMFDSGYKFGFFSRNKDHSDENKSKDKEKRRSGIGIPNISELDREAAEIVNKEHAHEKAKERAEQEKFFQPPEHLLLQQQMFASKGQNQLASETENAIQVVSTKDLISKFESSSNAARVTLNTSFIGRTDNFFQNKAHDVKIIENNLHTVSSDSDIVRNKSVAEVSKSPSIFSTTELTQDTKIEERQNLTGNGEAKVDKQAQNSISSTTWSCPFCTLENPNWRIICEVCERLKPFDKLGKEGTKPTAKLSAKIDPLPNPQNLKNNIDVKIKSIPQSAQNIVEKVDNVNLKLLLSESNDWEKKADRVMKYFMPRNNNIGLSKSASETAVVKKPPVSRKSPSPSKVPICSPNFSRRSKVQRKEEKSKSNNDIKNADAIHEKEANFGEKERKKPLLDSSVIVTTITPVFYATTTAMTQPEVIKKQEYDTKKSSVDLKEVRSARLAKFSAKPQDQILSITEMSTESLEEQSLLNNDPDSLEREKMRLREKIRAMNAKAFAEKYPVLQNKSTQDNTQLNSNLNEKTEESISKNVREGDPTKRGAIKKVLNKNLSPDCSTPDEIQENPITHDIVANVSKPKKISTSAQTTGFVKKFNETRSHSRELLSENSNEIKLDNVVHSIDLSSEIPAIQPIQPYIINFSEHEKARVEEISQQLQSLEGISNFKATLRNPLKGISWTDTMALNKIMRSLELAIAEGQDELAAKIAMDLAKMKVSLQVTKVKNRPTSRSIDYNQSIIVDLLVEDKISQKGPIQILVKPLMTILELKEKALKDFEIPIELQKWLINDEPATDNNKILLEYGVRDCTSGFYLYLITPDAKCSEKKEIHLPIPKTSIAIHEDLDGNLSDASSDSHNELETNDSIESVQGAAALPFPKNSILESKCWQCPLCTLINSADVLACCACSKAKPHSTNFVLPYEDKYNMSEELRQFLEGNKISIQYRISEQKNDLNKTSPNRKSSEIFNIVADQNKAQPTVLLDRISPDGFKGALNSPSPNITKNRYRGVDNYNPNRQNGNGVLVTANRIPTPIKKEKLRAPAPPANTKTNHYLELLQLDNSDVVSNKVPFECPVCFMQFQKGEGIVLRDCLHSFCKECLSNTVRYSEEAEVKCPYMDAEYSCDSILQQREIKAIVTKEIYEQHLAKSIRVAEHQIENAFHCKTPNCRGWCIYEDNVNEFKCPVCRITNCLLCRVIHDGLTCKQFQDRLNSDCDSNLEARRTKDMIKEMVEKGEAMNCPTCQVIMMKKWGCDWLRCSMCKTEVCWVTRGPRWGPGGKGDTSGGCKCGVDGKKCHPKCNYCH